MLETADGLDFVISVVLSLKRRIRGRPVELDTKVFWVILMTWFEPKQHMHLTPLSNFFFINGGHTDRYNTLIYKKTGFASKSYNYHELGFIDTPHTLHAFDSKAAGWGAQLSITLQQ